MELFVILCCDWCQRSLYTSTEVGPLFYEITSLSVLWFLITCWYCCSLLHNIGTWNVQWFCISCLNCSWVVIAWSEFLHVKKMMFQKPVSESNFFFKFTWQTNSKKRRLYQWVIPSSRPYSAELNSGSVDSILIVYRNKIQVIIL